jgi:dTMP kinase
LERGEWVICDRFLDSTIAYQGYGHELGEGFVKGLYDSLFANDEIVHPDITFILDIPVEIGIKRALSRRGTEERFENMDIAFHQRLREGFLEIAENEPERCKVLNADRNIEEINEKILENIIF